MRSHELVWVAGLLECLPQVDVIGVEVRDGHIPQDDGSTLLVADMRVEVPTIDQARVLVDALGLGSHGKYEVLRHRPLLRRGKRFRFWQGWAPEGSHEIPVCVEIIAPVVASEEVA